MTRRSSTIGIQTNMLRYLFQYNTARTYIPYLNHTVFDLVEHQMLFNLLVEYMKKYNSSPDVANIMHFAAQFPEFEDDALEVLRSVAEQSAEELTDTPIVKEELLMYAKKKIFTELVNGPGMDLLEEFDEKALLSFHGKIKGLTSLDLEKRTKPITLFGDQVNVVRPVDKVYPTFVKGLNSFTGKGGFYAPQLLLFAKPPKAFGTGLMILLLLDMIKHGHDVIYGDWENGEAVILDRFKQGMVKMTAEDILTDDGKRAVKNMMRMYKKVGSGDVLIKGYRPKKNTMDDFDLDVEEFMNENPNFDPKAVAFDYLDILKCSDPYIREKREKIQQNYHDAVSFNIKYGTFGYTTSKIKTSSVGKEYYEVTDLAEDFEKAYNCHGSFGLVTDKDMMEKGYIRLHPIIQRDGISYTDVSAHIHLEADKMHMNELIDFEEDSEEDFD